ncbi:N-acetylglucosaminyltransferase II [Dillenia turbinata]|uniref:Alpha-1,6-mannosyl-glycoprotein 2-beta-N-acetylglucosaminyltransferase n=1 Tax=Dillenia turbinata TaxID=194707 RepID=A0AAN8YZH1_9MAGN
MAPYKKTQIKDAAFRRYLFVVFVTGLGIFLLLFLLKSNSTSDVVTTSQSHDAVDVVFIKRQKLNLPKQNELSISLAQRNQLPPRNLDLYPNLPKDHITIVLYVHNRPQYLKVVVQSLSQVVGISETLLVVSHDGFFEEMNKIIEGIKFCQVKQIFAPYSPHLFPNSFPGVSPGDCKEKDDPTKMHCTGNPDQYGNHRSPKIVSLKHHWWWMMNMVWDGLKETRQHQGHILFIEEDHFIFPNAYRNLQILLELKPLKCPDCYAANLAPYDVKSKGENWDMLVAERMGNIGYTFNRTVWRKIHNKANEFCLFDEYNWDITMWATVYPSFGGPVYSLRGPRPSAVHFGKCGLHQGQDEKGACIDNGVVDIEVGKIDKIPNIKPEWSLHLYKHQGGYQAGFKGWGGWGDKRDHQLCLAFASMYLLADSPSSSESD